MGILTNKQPIFWNTNSVTNLSGCFSQCTTLTSIPHDLFDDWERAQRLRDRRLKLDKIYGKLKH